MDWHYVNWDVEKPDLPDCICEVICRCVSPNSCGSPMIHYQVCRFVPKLGKIGGFLSNEIITHWAYFDKPAYVKDVY